MARSACVPTEGSGGPHETSTDSLGPCVVLCVFRSHVPYRDSKLTQILQPSLSGDARVAVIATCNPSPAAIEETKSTLKFAQRVKKVVLKAAINEVVDDKALITKYRSHVSRQAPRVDERSARTTHICFLVDCDARGAAKCYPCRFDSTDTLSS